MQHHHEIDVSRAESAEARRQRLEAEEAQELYTLNHSICHHLRDLWPITTPKWLWAWIALGGFASGFHLRLLHLRWAGHALTWVFAVTCLLLPLAWIDGSYVLVTAGIGCIGLWTLIFVHSFRRAYDVMGAAKKTCDGITALRLKSQQVQKDKLVLERISEIMPARGNTRGLTWRRREYQALE